MKRLVNSIDDGGRSIVSVAGRLGGLGVFVRRQRLLQFLGFALPTLGGCAVRPGEGLRQSAPADILDELRLFFWRSLPAFGLTRFQDADCCEIVAVFLFGTALTEFVAGGDAVIYEQNVS